MFLRASFTLDCASKLAGDLDTISVSLLPKRIAMPRSTAVVKSPAVYTKPRSIFDSWPDLPVEPPFLGFSTKLPFV